MNYLCRLVVLIGTCILLCLSSAGFLWSLRVEAANVSPSMQPLAKWVDSLPLQIDDPIVTTASAASTSTKTILNFFDANASDLVYPGSHNSNYGKKPEIVVVPTGNSLTVLAQNYHPSTNSVLFQLEPSGDSYTITQMLPNLPMLERIMGLAVDTSGNRYYATAVNEETFIDQNISPTPPGNPPPGQYRSNIVRVVKINSAGEVLFNTDLDIARKEFAGANNPEQVINPMKAGSARLAVAGNEVALVHAIMTVPDYSIGGTRHQKVLSTRLNATTGAVIRNSSIWVSHSFDQRLFVDETKIFEYQLGDAYPRSLVLGSPDHRSYTMFHIKGRIGDNNTYTRLGNLALIEQDPTYGYLALFVSESTPTTSGSGNVLGPRNLAIVRVNRNNYSLDPSLQDSLTVTVGTTERMNKLRWLTNYSAASNLHAERPKLVGIGNDHYIVLWEQYEGTQFQGVYGIRINAQGEILAPATLLTNAHHLHRGDDAFRLGDGAAWMTAVKPEDHKQRLLLHAVDASLRYTVTSILLPLATVQGTVTAVGGAPVADAVVMLADSNVTATTDATGKYSLQVAPGVYTLSVTAWPYLIAKLPDIAAGAGATTVVDAQLTPLQTAALTGRVQSSGSGIPLYASVQISSTDRPISTTVWTDPHTGLYSSTLYQMNYRLTVIPWSSEYISASTVTALTGATNEQNFALHTNLPPVDFFADEFATSASPGNNWTINGQTSNGRWRFWRGTVYFNSSPTEGTQAGSQARMFREFDFTTKFAPNINLMLNHNASGNINDTLQLQVCTQMDCSSETSWINVGNPMRHKTPPPIAGMTAVTYTQSLADYGGQVVKVGILATAGGWGKNQHVERLTVDDRGRVGGGIVAGIAYDQFNIPAIGVTITDGRSTVTTTSTPDDSGVTDGFYAIWMPGGTTVMTATFTGFSPIMRAVSLVDGTVQRQDFVFTTSGLTPTPETPTPATPTPATPTPETPTPETPTPATPTPATPTPETPTPETPTPETPTPATPTPETPTPETPTPETPTPATPTPGVSLQLSQIEPNQGLNTIPNEVSIQGIGLRNDSLFTIGGTQLEILSAGTISTTKVTALVPAGLVPALYAVVVRNPDGTSHTLPDSYTVIDANGLDLAITDSDFWFEPATPRQDTEMTIGINVHRSGGTQTLAPIAVQFYLDTIDPNSLLGTASVPPLAPGTDVVDSAFTLWTPAVAGQHTLYAVVDPEDRVIEGSETNNRAQWTFNVLPATTADTTPPSLNTFQIADGAQSTTQPFVQLALNATDNSGTVATMYLIERVYSNAARRWIPLQQSGWIAYADTVSTTLSAGGGVHYLQLWAADRAGNVSSSSLQAPINYLPEQDRVRAGQVRIYRITLASGETLDAAVTPSTGDPDLYLWDSSGTLVDYSNNYESDVDQVTFVAPIAGTYQIEVYGYADSVYGISLSPTLRTQLAAASTLNNKAVPEAPSVALEAAPSGQQALPAAPNLSNIFLPLIGK